MVTRIATAILMASTLLTACAQESSDEATDASLQNGITVSQEPSDEATDASLQNGITVAQKPSDEASDTNRQNWITISYKGLVDGSILTHSGDTVGEIMRKLSQNPTSEDLKGLVQPYLEPFSFVCNDILAITNDIDSPLINILSYYPLKSKQPAWVAMFREGHYQLYFGEETIRIFLKGDSSETLFRNYVSVIRHPIEDLLKSMDIGIKKIEIYAFKNNYAKGELQLDTTPFTISIENVDLSTQKSPIDIEGLQEFFKEGVILEAAEVDENNNFYLYGRRSNDQTVYGKPISISDFSVVYRSVFHYGHNAPYISLDGHEDNRYAKVNFGGLLENTRVGGVVLESDKLFKTLSVGLDPNTKTLVINKAKISVPDFLTEDERSLLHEGRTGQVEIRYWFYPDEISTETDGRIGVVLSSQFLADVERMDAKASVQPAQRDTIDHLNTNFFQYQNAFRPFKELSSIGRMMALVNWLKGMDLGRTVDLDALLSVELPAIETPKKTEKMLAITGIAYTADRPVSKNNVGRLSKVYYLSHLLGKSKNEYTDDQFLLMATDYFEAVLKDDLIPEDLVEPNRLLRSLDVSIKNDENRLNRRALELKEIDKRTTGYSPQHEIDKYNHLVEEHNALASKINEDRDTYNSIVGRINSSEATTAHIVSIGGGINLAPQSFAKTIRNAQSAGIREIRAFKESLISATLGTESTQWIRSGSQSGKNSVIHKLPVRKWTTSTFTKAGNVERVEISFGDNGRIWVSRDSTSGDLKYKTIVHSSTHEISVDKQRNTATIETQLYPRKIEVSLDEDQRITLSRGGVAGRGLTPPSWMELR